jgi:hypothetical protein
MPRNVKSGKECKKSTYFEVEARVGKIYELILQNYSRYEIIQYVANSTDWKIGDRMIDKYIAEAKKILDDANSEKYEEYLKKTKAQLEMLYKIACDESNLSEARQIKIAENKILGYERLNIEHSGEVKTVDILDIFKDLKDQLNDDKTESKTKNSIKNNN